MKDRKEIPVIEVKSDHVVARKMGLFGWGRAEYLKEFVPDQTEVHFDFEETLVPVGTYDTKMWQECPEEIAEVELPHKQIDDTKSIGRRFARVVVVRNPREGYPWE